MGRPTGSKNKTTKANGGAKAPGPKVTKHSNQTELTDDQLQALTAEHVRSYSKALDVKKKADAEFKNICKVAKSEGVKLADIKAYIAAGTEEGQARLREDAERLARMSRWHGFPLGAQLPLFEEDENPATNRSFRLGKEAGMAGEKAVVPTDCDHEQYMAGWHDGQNAKIMSMGVAGADSQH